jgi:hypothetical protein
MGLEEEKIKFNSCNIFPQVIQIIRVKLHSRNLIAKSNLEVGEQSAIWKGHDCMKNWSATHRWRSTTHIERATHWGFLPSANSNDCNVDRGHGAYTQKPDFAQNLQPIAFNPLNFPSGVNLSVYHTFLWWYDDSSWWLMVAQKLLNPTT